VRFGEFAITCPDRKGDGNGAREHRHSGDNGLSPCSRNSPAPQAFSALHGTRNPRTVTAIVRVDHGKGRSGGTPRLSLCVLVAYVRHRSGRTPNPAAARSRHTPGPVNGRSGRPTGTTACYRSSGETGLGLSRAPRGRASPARTRQLTSQAPERNSSCPPRVSTDVPGHCVPHVPSPSPVPVAPLSPCRSSAPPAPTPPPPRRLRRRQSRACPPAPRPTARTPRRTASPAPTS